MKYFTIDAENAITLHPTKKAAKETGAAVFSTEEQLADTIGNDNKRLVEIWNSLPGVKPVTKFTSRKIATERVWKAIQTLAGPAPEFRSCVEAVEALTATEAQAELATPFDSPEPAAHIEEPPAVTAASEQLATASAQEPNVAPPRPRRPRRPALTGTRPRPRRPSRAKTPAGLARALRWPR